MNRDVFASLATRIKAGVIDSIVLLTLFILIPVTMGTYIKSDSPVTIFAMFAPILLLEPFLVAFSGATIGQHVFGIVIIRIDTRSNCPLHVAFLRYIFKMVLGSISLIYMLFSQKHQAIHDHFAKTFVLISEKKLEKNPEMEKYGEIEQPLLQDYIYPSAIRRFLIFIAWYFVSIIILGIVFEIIAILIISGYTVESERLPEFLEMTLSIVLSIVFIALAVFASKGLLIGARRKKKKQGTAS